MFLLLGYDVPAERTEKYRKLLSRYLSQVQFSVFAGDLTETAYRKLRREIDGIYQNSDRLVIIQTSNRRNICMATVKAGVTEEDTSHLGSSVLS